LNTAGECVDSCANNEYEETCSVTNIKKCYECHKSCASCTNGLADSCESCATGYRKEPEGIEGVCYPEEEASEFNKWKTNY